MLFQHCPYNSNIVQSIEVIPHNSYLFPRTALLLLLPHETPIQVQYGNPAFPDRN